MNQAIRFRPATHVKRSEHRFVRKKTEGNCVFAFAAKATNKQTTAKVPGALLTLLLFSELIEKLTIANGKKPISQHPICRMKFTRAWKDVGLPIQNARQKRCPHLKSVLLKINEQKRSCWLHTFRESASPLV
jgi:hypothetical protein